ncbi:hypothetical protein HDV05_008228, partial [Chytridiales sp. JEL 0842]
MPYLFEDCTDEVEPDSEIYYPTSLLLSISCYDRLKRLVSLGYKMESSHIKRTSEQCLWLWQNRLCNFRQLFLKLDTSQLPDLCADCPIMSRLLKHHCPNLVRFLANRSVRMDHMTLKGLKMIVDMQFDGYNTFLWVDHVVWRKDLEVLKYFHQRFPNSATTEAMDTAANVGNLEAVRFLHENRNEGCTTKAMDHAAARHLNIVKFLHFNRTEGCTTEAMDTAALHGTLEIVKFLHNNRTEGFTGRSVKCAV